MTSANHPLRAAAFRILFWANAIGWSAALVWQAGLPLMDLKKLAANEPMPWQVSGVPELQPLGEGSESRLTLLEDRRGRSTYRCDLTGLRSTTCIASGAPLPVGRARVDYVDLPDGAGSPAHRMPLRVVIGGEVVYSRSFEEAVSTARNRCLLLAAAGVGAWLVVNLALTGLWNLGRKEKA